MEDELDRLMKPLFDAIPKNFREEVMSAYRAEKEGVLAWGVRSGYLLWVRTHPGEMPTLEQVEQWMIKAKKEQ